MHIKDYYATSLGEALEVMLPAAIKRCRKLTHEIPFSGSDGAKRGKPSQLFIQHTSQELLVAKFKEAISETINKKETVIMLVPEVGMIPFVQEPLKEIAGLAMGIWHGKLSSKKMLSLWSAIKNKEINLLIGSRSCVFAPMHQLGLIIIVDENDPSYKDDQVPYYHAREVARLRSRIEKCDLVFSSIVPSAHMQRLINENEVSFVRLDDQVQSAPIIFNRISYRNKIDIMIERQIAEALEKREKVIVFHNRRGFATYVSCKSCKKILQCERCSSNFHYDYDKKELFCPCCNYRLPMKELCPYCKASYVQFEGLGAEKLSSNLKRVFPLARVLTQESTKEIGPEESYDMLITTKKRPFFSGRSFDLSIIWNADSLFNVGDYNAAEYAYQLLCYFLAHTRKKMIVCTGLPHDFYVFKNLAGFKSKDFFDSEFISRKELQLSPFYHVGLLSLRGADKEKVGAAAEKISQLLNAQKQKGVYPSDPFDTFRSKVRGKFYRYIMIKSKNIKVLNRAVKTLFEKCKFGGVIITATIDPM